MSEITIEARIIPKPERGDLVLIIVPDGKSTGIHELLQSLVLTTLTKVRSPSGGEAWLCRDREAR